MAKIISQETFDDVVKENIIDFSMTPDEAKDETIKQFEAQGVNLANIIKDLSINTETGKPVLNETIENLKNHISGVNKLNTDKLKIELKTLDTECKKSIAHRVLAAKNGSHDVLFSILNEKYSDVTNKTTTKLIPDNSNNNNNDIILMCLQAANSITNKQPDIFNDNALNLIINILSNEKDAQIISITLKWLSKACIMHETNRQSIMNANIMKLLKPLISLDDEKILCDVLLVFRCLILDDDIRVEFGKAHEHARTIAQEVLVDLTKLLAKYDDNLNVLCSLLLTISALIVRHEFCIIVDEAGGLKAVLELISKYSESVELIRESLKLIRALAGHDAIKAHIGQLGAAPIIHELLITHKSKDTLVTAALGCIALLTLRSKENCLEFFKSNLPETIVEILKMYSKNKTIVRNASWVTRNMVSRLREYSETFILLGIEDLLNAAMKEHPSIEYDIKAALRDLGCNVKLKEEWTGTAKIKISN